MPCCTFQTCVVELTGTSPDPAWWEWSLWREQQEAWWEEGRIQLWAGRGGKRLKRIWGRAAQSCGRGTKKVGVARSWGLFKIYRNFCLRKLLTHYLSCFSKWLWLIKLKILLTVAAGVTHNSRGVTDLWGLKHSDFRTCLLRTQRHNLCKNVPSQHFCPIETNWIRTLKWEKIKRIY